jgi:hypothetical protein
VTCAASACSTCVAASSVSADNTPTAATIYEMEIGITSSLVTFYINGNSACTTSANISTNTATGLNYYVDQNHIPSGGTAHNIYSSRGGIEHY